MKAKNILVIGGSSGIGLEIVNQLIEKEYNVIAASRTPKELEKIDGVQYVRFDAVNDELPLDDLPPDMQGLVYCPGTIRLIPFNHLRDQDFRDDFEINFMSAVRVLRACFPRLRKSTSGASVVLFSTVAVQTGMPFHASIAGAKGAVEGLTRSLAAEFAPKIRVNAIAPSITDTPMAERLLNREERRKASAERHPMKRVGTPKDIASFATFLLDERASWITGEIFHVDGGMNSLRLFT